MIEWIRDKWFDFKLWVEYDFVPSFRSYSWLTFFAGFFMGITLCIVFIVIIG